MSLLAAKGACLALFFLVPVACGLLPLVLAARRRHKSHAADVTRARWRQAGVTFLNCFAGGVFLGTCLLGTMVEGYEQWTKFLTIAGVVTSYPTFHVAIGAGFFLVALVEKVVFKLHEKHGNHGTSNHEKQGTNKTHDDHEKHAKTGFEGGSVTNEKGDALEKQRTAEAVNKAYRDGEDWREKDGGNEYKVVGEGGGGDGGGDNLVGVVKTEGETSPNSKRKSQPDSQREKEGGGTEKNGGKPEERSLDEKPVIGESGREKGEKDAWEEKKLERGWGGGEGPICQKGGEGGLAGEEGENHGVDDDDDKKEDDDDDAAMSSVRVGLLVLALSFHTIFDGLAVGLQTNASSLWSMLAAIIVHKVITSFCLGIELATGMHTRRAVASLLLYSLMAPLGVAIGMALTSGSVNLRAQLLAGSLLQAVATGAFLYVTSMEILGRAMAGHDGNITKVLVAVAGFGVMCGVKAFGGEH